MEGWYTSGTLKKNNLQNPLYEVFCLLVFIPRANLGRHVVVRERAGDADGGDDLRVRPHPAGGQVSAGQSVPNKILVGF